LPKAPRDRSVIACRGSRPHHFIPHPNTVLSRRPYTHTPSRHRPASQNYLFSRMQTSAVAIATSRAGVRVARADCANAYGEHMAARLVTLQPNPIKSARLSDPCSFFLPRSFLAPSFSSLLQASFFVTLHQFATEHRPQLPTAHVQDRNFATLRPPPAG